MPPPVRIVSDVHFGEAPSRVRALDELAPLLEGAAELLCNGDTVETRFLDVDPATRDPVRRLEEFRARAGGILRLLTGNHDPDLTAEHSADLADGAVFVTHGDTVFPEMTPWGREAPRFRDEQERRLAATPLPDRGTWETRTRVCKEAILAVREWSPRWPSPRRPAWRRRIDHLFDLARAGRILRAWREAPDRTAALARAFRPAARVVIVGHTHRPGVWRRQGVTVVNTGAFLPPFGPRCVEVGEDRCVVREVKRAAGVFQPARVLAEIALDP